MSNPIMTRDKLFSQGEPLKLKRSGFDLKHTHKSGWRFGYLYPVSNILTLPGDTISTNISSKMIAESLLKPIYEDINVKIKGFDVALRNLWEHWRNYYTGGRKGDFTTQEPKVNLNCRSNVEGSLFDYLGFPQRDQLQGDVFVSAFPFIAYDFVYFWHFINPELQENIVYNIQDNLSIAADNNGIKYCTDELEKFLYYCENFYLINEDGIPLYTRMLGGINGSTSRNFRVILPYGANIYSSDRYMFQLQFSSGSGYSDCPGGVLYTSDGQDPSFTTSGSTFVASNVVPLRWTTTTVTGDLESVGHISNEQYRNAINLGFLYRVNWQKDYFTSAHQRPQAGTAPALPLESNISFNIPNDTPFADVQINSVGSTADVLSNSSTNSVLNTYNNIIMGSFNWQDLRLWAQISLLKENILLSQKMFEYQSYLNFFFGSAPSKEALRIPQYIGGSTFKFYTGEVIQTSSTTSNSPLGNYAGKAQFIDNGSIDSYFFNDFAIQLYVMYIMPATVTQTSQGVNRMWLYNDRYDYYNPLFAHLGMQEIQRKEVYATGTSSADNGIFGYTGSFNELRFVPDYVTGALRSSLDIWTLSRKYDQQPVGLNSSYILSDVTDRVFAVQDNQTPQFTGAVVFNMTAYRNLPESALPGLIDHRY